MKKQIRLIGLFLCLILVSLAFVFTVGTSADTNAFEPPTKGPEVTSSTTTQPYPGDDIPPD